MPEIGKVFQKHSIDVITETEDGQTHPLSYKGSLQRSTWFMPRQGRENPIG